MPAMQRRIKTKKDEYILMDDVLGVGGTSIVRLGQRVRDQKKFALKFFKDGDINGCKAAEEEYKLSMKLGIHANLVNTVDYQVKVRYPIHPDDGGGFEDCLGVVVSDYCPNGTLIDVLTSEKVAAGGKTLDARLATHICKQLLTALAHVHSPAVDTAHCDLKWEQVLLDEDYNVKLADFGSGASLKSRRSFWCATPAYWTPEQVEDDGNWSDVEPEKADIFAAGLMLHIAFCTKPPFGKADARPYNEGGDWFYDALTSEEPGMGPPRFFEVMNGYGIHLPDNVKDMFVSMTSYDAEDRKSAATLLKDPVFKKHQMSSKDYTAGMAKFFQMAYPGGKVPVKGYSDYEGTEEFSNMSTKNKHLFRGAAEDGPKPMPISASALTNTATRFGLRITGVPVVKAPEMALKLAAALRRADGSVDFKPASPFVADAVWAEVYKPEPKKHENGIAKFGRGAAHAMSNLFLHHHGRGKAEPLRMRVRLQSVEDGRKKTLVAIFDHLAGASAHFKMVCKSMETALASPALTHVDEDDKGARYVKTKNASYKLLPTILGVGGTSVVRLGERQSDKKKFALKFYKKLSPSDLDDARNEFKTSKMLGEHPHLVNTVDFEENVAYPLHERDGGGSMEIKAMLVTDYCPNGTVIDLLTKMAEKGAGKLSTKSASMVSKQLLEALHHIHSKKVAHCDLKYEQCLLDEDFNLKLLDFGSAAINLKRRRCWCSTQQYWSPEQYEWEGDWEDVMPTKADLFAAGTMMHIAYTSSPPFGGATDSDWYWMALSGQGRPTADFYTQMGRAGIKFPEGLHGVFQKLCDYEQEERPTAGQALEDATLADFLKGYSLQQHKEAMAGYHGMAYEPEQLPKDPEQLQEFASETPHNQHLYRGSDAATHNPPQLEGMKDTGSLRTVLYTCISGDKMASTAQNEFKALLKKVDDMGAHAETVNDKPFMIAVEWPKMKRSISSGAASKEPEAAQNLKDAPTGPISTVKDLQDQLERLKKNGSPKQTIRRLKHRIKQLQDKQTEAKVASPFAAAAAAAAAGGSKKRRERKKPSGAATVPPPALAPLTAQVDAKEPLRVNCSFGKVSNSEGRDTRLALRLKHLAGSTSEFDAAVKKIVEAIKRRATDASAPRMNATKSAPSCLGHATSKAAAVSPRRSTGGVDSLGHGLHLAFVGASPLIDKTGKALPHLDIQQELSRVVDVVNQSNKDVKWAARMGKDTKSNLEDLLACGACILHVSAHGTSKGELLFESGAKAGDVQRFPSDNFASMLKNKGDRRPRLLMLMNCFSQSVAKGLKDDIDHIVCVDERFPILDAAVKVFSKNLYQELFNGAPVITAFRNAKEAVRMQDTSTVMQDASRRFFLLDEDAPRHNEFVFPQIQRRAAGEKTAPVKLMHNVRDVHSCSLEYPHRVRFFGGRDEEMIQVMRTFTDQNRNFVLLHGPRGIGKSALATMTGRYMFDHSMVDHIFAIGPADSAIKPNNLIELLGKGLGLSSLADIYSKDGKKKKDKTEAFMKWKSEHSKSLIIIDNCQPFFSYRPFLTMVGDLLKMENCKMLLIGRKPMRELQEVLDKNISMSMVSVGPLSPLDAATLFQKLAVRPLTFDEMGPLAGQGKTTEENLSGFFKSPVMNLFPGRNPERIRRGAMHVPDKPMDIKKYVSNLKKEFERADADNSGTINFAEMSSYLVSLGYSEQIVKQVFGLHVEISKQTFHQSLKRWGPSVELARAIDTKMKEDEAKAQDSNTYPLESLTTRDVLMLMRFNGLGQFCRAFRSNSVDGSLLATVEVAEELAEIGVNTKLHRKKLFHLIRGWKESTQMVTRDELEEAEKSCGSSLVDASSRMRSSPDIQRAEFMRVGLATAAYELMRRLNSILAGYLCKSSLQFRQQHWKSKDLYAEVADICDDMANLDSQYAILTTLFVFGRYFAFQHLTTRSMSVFMDERCPVHIYPTLLNSIRFAFTGEGINLSMDFLGKEQHPEWKLGPVASGIFQVMSYEQTEIGESMLEKADNAAGFRCLSFIEFKAKYKASKEFRRVFSRVSTTCDMLHSQDSVRFYCACPKNKVWLKKQYCGRVVWLHNQLCTLVWQLDHNLVLKSSSLQVDQQALQDQVEILIREQEIRDLMKGFQRKLMCKSIFTKWLAEHGQMYEGCKDVSNHSECLIGNCTVHVDKVMAPKLEVKKSYGVEARREMLHRVSVAPAVPRMHISKSSVN